MKVKVQLTVILYAQSIGEATASLEKMIKAGSTGVSPASHPEVESIDKVQEIKLR